MDHESENLVPRNFNNYTMLKLSQRNDKERAIKIIVRYHVVYGSLTSRWTLKAYRVINTELLFSPRMSIEAARDFAIHHFPKAHPTPDFTYALVSYMRGEENYDVLDYSANLGEFFDGGDTMDIFTDPNFFVNRNLQMLFGAVCLMISGLSILVLVRGHF